MQRLSLNELSKLVLSQSGESNSENVERRAWRETLPVIHLAAAMQIAARIADYLHEMIAFPKGRYNDQVDSTSQALKWFNYQPDEPGIIQYYRQLV